MPSQASGRFTDNKRDLELLWHIYAELPGSGVLKKQRQDVIIRSAIVFICACWESYIEDVAVEAFDFLLAKANTPDLIPWKIRALASRGLKEAKDERAIWDLAGDGWRNVLQSHREAVLVRWLGEFNTPKSKAVATLFHELIGISDISSNWVLKTISYSEVCEKLDEYITMRGNIAHRIRHEQELYKGAAKKFLALVTQLVRKTDEAVACHLTNLTGAPPWENTAVGSLLFDMVKT